jgi:hypothetical protein
MPVCLMLVSLAGVPCAGADTFSPRQFVDATCSQVMGLRPGETYFARCQENLSQVMLAGSETGRAMADAGGPDASKSFYEVNPRMRWDRERHACARVGLIPGSVSFHMCVTGLDGAFMPSPN